VGSNIEQYLHTLDQALGKIREFKPDYLVLSLGLDIVAGDPVGGFVLQPGDFSRVAAAIAGLNIPTLLLQEGGYLENTLAACITSFMNGFFGK
jgi:acetoin utilization deacetylase AcuC-like enzyme